MKTPKKCKGSGKSAGHGCGKALDFTERNGLRTYDSKYGLGKKCKCYSKWLLSTDEGKAQIERETLKATAPARSLKEYEEQRKCETSLSYLKNRVMTICHTYIKLRDKGKPCVSCGHPWRSDNQAGHWKKASDYSSLKYDERNIHNQCQKCNLMKDGNVQEYGDNITKRISNEDKQDLERQALEYKKGGFKWDRITLNETREYYKQKLKDLENRSIN